MQQSYTLKLQCVMMQLASDPGGFGPTDEPVNGTITSTVKTNRSDGQVINAAPIVLTLSELE